jgi:cell division control protein 6
MESENMRRKIEDEIEHTIASPVIKNKRFLEDEQLIKSEQLAVLEEIFNTNVRDMEITKLSKHFTPIFRNDHPYHIAVWGKTGTGKTLTLTYFLNLLLRLGAERNIQIRYKHLDLSTPVPCFRALNDLACLLNAMKRYQRGISLDEMMLAIEAKLADYPGYLILFIDEVDNIRRDKDTFMAFLIRRLPQKIPAKLILVFASNHLDWPDHLDPRVKSFLKMNEIIFKPYDAVDLQHILRIRVEKALCQEAIEPGVIEKIAALASYDHGDARKAVALLAKSAYLAEQRRIKVKLSLVDEAAKELDMDRYSAMLKSAPKQLQAAMASVIEAAKLQNNKRIGTADAYDAYRKFCKKARVSQLSGRAFGDLIGELDLYSFIRSRMISRGRYGRAREIILELPEELLKKIYGMILLKFQLR